MNLGVNDIINLSRSASASVVAADKDLYSGVAATSDTTPATILSITPDDQTAGILEVWCAGFDGINSASIIQRISFKKAGDAVSLGTVTSVMSEAGAGENVLIATDGQSITVSVTGAVAAYNWAATYKLISVLKEAALA